MKKLFSFFRQIIKEFVYRLRGEYTTEKLIKMGLVVGDNFKRLNGVILDPSHCLLIDIGNNVTMAPRVHIICHDASTKTFLNYTKIGRVIIGDNVFIGADTTVLPGVTIGSNVIIGAHSTITHDVPSGVVVCGNPASIKYSLDDYLAKEKERMLYSPCYGAEYTLREKVSFQKRLQQREDLSDCIGYID